MSSEAGVRCYSIGLRAWSELSERAGERPWPRHSSSRQLRPRSPSLSLRSQDKITEIRGTSLIQKCLITFIKISLTNKLYTVLYLQTNYIKTLRKKLKNKTGRKCSDQILVLSYCRILTTVCNLHWMIVFAVRYFFGFRDQHLIPCK